MPQTTQLLKKPQRRSLLARSSLRNPRRHLQFPIQIMGQDSRHHKKLVPQKIPNGDIIHLALRLQFPQDALLRRTPVMIPQNLLPRSPLVRHDHLELIPILIGNEQVQLDGPLADRRAALTNEQESIRFLPLLGLPGKLKKRPGRIQDPPTVPLLNPFLQTPQNAQTEEPSLSWLCRQ